MVLKENGGQASALNVGVERCHGDVVMFLDADDVLHPDAAAEVAAAFAADAGRRQGAVPDGRDRRRGQAHR